MEDFADIQAVDTHSFWHDSASGCMSVCLFNGRAASQPLRNETVMTRRFQERLRNLKMAQQVD